MKRLLQTILFLAFFGCENIVVNDQPDNTQRNNFEIYWNDFDQNYAAFTVRNINWDSIYLSSIEQISSGLTEDEFREMMAMISLSFKDIHVELITPQKKILYDSKNPNSANGLRSIGSYLRSITEEGQVLKYATVRNQNIGYIQIPTFSGSISESEFKRIDQVLAALKDTDGIIVDIRNNQGGNLLSQEIVASRFVDKSFIYFRNRLRNGPNHNDFAAPFEETITPDGAIQYLKPVVILTNRKSASAAEAFAMTLRKMGNITLVGDTTAAGLGINIRRELPNGWSYRMTIGLVSDSDDISYEGIGVPPDEVVFISKQDSLMSMDKQLSRAIELLQ